MNMGLRKWRLCQREVDDEPNLKKLRQSNIEHDDQYQPNRGTLYYPLIEAFSFAVEIIEVLWHVLLT